jgi:RNA polymerase sigma-70 factor (ECF subfamily)
MTAQEFSSSLLEMTPNLQRFALSLTADRNKAPDLVQDTVMTALVSRDKFIEFTNLRAWVFTIMRNTFINNYRRKVKENNIFDKSKDLLHIKASQDRVYISPESSYDLKEIERSIDSLGNKFKVPFKLYLDGYKYKEIADELGLKMGTVKSRIFFTRQKLTQILKEHAG